MILEHGLSQVSAKWDIENNCWDIGQKKTYRWCDSNNKPVTDWFTDFRAAIDWIVDYDLRN